MLQLAPLSPVLCFLRFTHVDICSFVSYFKCSIVINCMCLTMYFCILLLVDIYIFSSFSSLTKNIAIDILFAIASLGTHGRISLGYKSRGGIARFVNMPIFNITSYCQIMFQITIPFCCCSLWSFCLFILC